MSTEDNEPAVSGLILDVIERVLPAVLADTVNMRPPQLTRTDGVEVMYTPKTPEEYAALETMESEELKKVGCQIWSDFKGKTHWLYPAEWYGYIPAGTEVVDILGNTISFMPGETSGAPRFGALAYGFVQERENPIL